jgi:hypothetical protein
MRDWIAGAIGLLCALLVLGGAATILSRAWFNRPPAEEPTTSSTSYGVGEIKGRLARLSPPERLIAWGAILLVLAAIAAGAIGFSLGAAAPAK